MIMTGRGELPVEELAVGDRVRTLTGVLKPILQLGLRDEFVPHGDPAKLLSLQGLDAAGIEASIRARYADIIGCAPALKVVG